ncbi:dihydrolipoamide dehydrogenase [Jannaschia sp. EhC01]|nr:dihydrolipoamide dehydrogenase [Jannaschia sp. EhC01]
MQPETKTCAEISGGWGKTFGFKTYEDFHFPDHDICKGPFRDARGRIRKYDVVMADQVWEHLDRPYAATKHVYQMLNKGGQFYICTPFYVRYHAFPVDCSRWSARGLTNLLIECGFDEDKIEADEWGNLECARADCAKKWAKYNPEVNSLENDPKFPIVAWAVGTK